MSTVLHFNELALRNFLSFGNQDTVIDLSENGTVSIEGQNLDQGGSNGSGKTTIINALCYALYNKPFDNISLQRLINSTNATKNTMMEVRLSFTRGNDEYEIVRQRGETYSISVTKNGDDITPGKGVIECDAMIEDIIGISYELFTKTVIFSGNAVAFLQLPVAQQRAQIEELFNITLLSEKAVKLKELLKQTEQDLKIQEAVTKQQELAIELHNRHIEEAEARIQRWEQQRTAEIELIESSLGMLGTVDFELEQLLHDEKATLTTEGAYLAAKLAPAKKDLQVLTKRVGELLGEQTHLADARCPYCTQLFADAPKKLAEIEVQLEAHGEKLLNTEGIVTELQAKAKEQQTRLKEVQGAIQHANLKELLKVRENASAMQAKLIDLANTKNPHYEAHEQLQTETQKQVDTEKVDALRKRLEHQQFLLKLLTNKDSFLRRRIINKTIPFLNGRINEYTVKLGLPHIVKFDADMSCTVSEFGRELDFGNLSAGEKKRVNAALALAFRDVLHHLHAKTNILLIDELDGQLDGAGIDAIIRVLKEKARDDGLGIYVISHHPNIQGRLDRTMVIQKTHGFSVIVET
jgi:DNA repair exonuclease SbcCD ATPase subunit